MGQLGLQPGFQQLLDQLRRGALTQQVVRRQPNLDLLLSHPQLQHRASLRVQGGCSLRLQSGPSLVNAPA